MADEDGRAWFVGSDVAEALGYAEPAAIRQHCEGGRNTPPSDRWRHPGRPPDFQPDLYRLVVGSRLRRRALRALGVDVLPTIRRTGSYFAQPAAADMRGVNTAFWLIPHLPYGRHAAWACSVRPQSSPPIAPSPA
ncbi:BRO family protein [Castellaniella sp.]|uniref:BRO family protein n=1 Tax=Castellaniella sp. TaxID=1955812 RepID=UPI003A4C6CE9